MVKLKFWSRRGAEKKAGKVAVETLEKEPVTVLPLGEDYKIVESYYVYEPFAKINIVSIFCVIQGDLIEPFINMILAIQIFNLECMGFIYCPGFSKPLVKIFMIF